ncbi:MAG: hypothetical protein GF364_04440 [Candidatus Lokiarchaeota archaeon]|nr:hypothetical protein [Candidatus Lokiarchaeota archaeon]
MEKRNLKIPIDILGDRTFSILEATVYYLKNNKKLSYRKIAKILNRDDRTIFTVYKRAKKKLLKKRDK